MKKTLITLAAFGAFASAHALVLDNFTTGGYAVTLSSGSDLHFAPGAAVPGGIRGTYLSVLENPRNREVSMKIGPVGEGEGFAFVSADNRVKAFAQIAYGFSTTTPGSNPISMNMSGMNTINLNFDSNDLDLQVELVVFGHTETAASQKSIARTVLGGRSDTAFTESFDISGYADRDDVDSILFNFTTAPGGDFGLASVEAVPEPGSIAALVAGVGMMIARRRKA